jgi:phosphatidylglycerol:prolipoprotein diacylglycerol transferase
MKRPSVGTNGAIFKEEPPVNVLAFVNPIAVKLGPIEVRWYGLIFVIAVMAAVWTSRRAAKHRGLDPEFVPDVTMIIVPAGILGARLYEVFVLQWGYYSQHPGLILKTWEGGLAIHGGVLGALLCGGIYMKYRKQSFWLWADMIAPGLILAQAIGRWGNFLNQEAYGVPAPESIFNMLPGFIREGMTINGVVMHPTFLYESLWNVASFAVMYTLQRSKPPAGVVFSLYLILYNTGRYAIESIREDSSFIFGDIRVAQLMALAQIVAGMAFLAYHYLPARRAETSR